MQLAPEIPDLPFTATTAQRLGITRHRLDQLVAARVVRRVLQGVYVRDDVPDTTETRARAAALVLRPFVVLCDRTAAWIHGVDTFEYRELELLPPLETHVLRGHSPTIRRGCKPGTRDLSESDVMKVNGLLVTTPLRTALDLACKLSRRDGLAALDAFIRQHGLTREQMRRELVRYFRRRGVVQARRLVPLADGRVESPGESWTRLEIIDHGLLAPELQWWVVDRGVRLFRLDLAYPKHRIAIEYDGREFHDAEEHREHDRARRTWLEEHGWTVIVVTKDDFTDDAVTGWIDEIRQALRIAA